MSVQRGAHDDGRAGGAESFDHEIDVRGIANVGAWLAAITIASFAIVWLFYRGLSSHEHRVLDAPPSRLQEASAPRVPPGPRLLDHPESDFVAFRAEEHARLAGWGWVDAGKTVAHVPVEKAIASVAANGLPEFAPPAERPAP